MNDDLRNFTNGLGLMCEIWSMTYNKFIEMGYTHETALDHTKGIITAFQSTLPNNGGIIGG